MQLYTVDAAVDGYCLPRIYALLPGIPQDKYTTMWGGIRNPVGEDSDKARLVTMNFEGFSINAAVATFPNAAAA